MTRPFSKGEWKAVRSDLDPVKAQMLEALRRVVTFETCACADGWLTPPCHICQAKSAIRAAEEEQC